MLSYYNNLQKKLIEENQELSRKFIKGFANMMAIEEVEMSTTPKEVVYEEDKMKIYHYIPMVKKPHSIPVLVVYALVNRQYMLDIQEDRSTIKNWLEAGLDVYVVDWGYPDHTDKFLTMEDYIEGYIHNAVNFIRKRHNLEKINLLGICQGGTMSMIYTALHPENIQNLVTMVTPFDFHTKDGLLMVWGKHLNIDNIVDVFGTVPGSFMNYGFNLLKPFQLNLDKYINFVESMDDPEAVKDFIRMEKWIYDSPDQAGEMLREFITEFYKENKLVKGTFELAGKKVDMKNITMPFLSVVGTYDHLVPPSATKPMMEAVGSTDKTFLEFKTGHIGIFVSSKSQKEVAPAITNWIKERGGETPKKKTTTRKTTAKKTTTTAKDK